MFISRVLRAFVSFFLVLFIIFSIFLRTFFELPLTQEILGVPVWRWLALESSGSFELAGATVVVKPDFAWRDEEDHVVLVDWKTGLPREADELLQLSTYGLYAQRSWGLKNEHMLGQIAYLATGKVKEYQITREQLDTAQERCLIRELLCRRIKRSLSSALRQQCLRI